MKKYIYKLLFLSLVVFTSCDDEFLDVKSTNLTDDLLWSSQPLVETYIKGLYNGIKLTNKEEKVDDGATGFLRGFGYALWASISDEAIFSNDDETWLVQRGQLSPSIFGFTSTAWGRSYRGIRDVNLALQKLPELVDISDERRAILISEIRFIRAWRYFILLKGFGGVPLIGDRVAQIGEDFTELYDRKTIAQTLDYIISELDVAGSGLPDKFDGDWERGRATSEVALALKSRVLLYAASPLYGGARTWASAADAAQEVMDLGYYSLERGLDADAAENYRKLFFNGPTDEDIFLREFNTSNWTASIEMMNGPNGYGGWGGNCPMQNFVDDFEMSNGMAIDEAGSGYDDQDPYVNRDPRFYSTVLYNGASYRGRDVETFLPGGQDSADGDSPWNTSPSGYYMRKFINEDISISPADWSNIGTNSPWRYFRYAEILLNYAEAQNEAVGPDQSVYDAVDDIRLRAGMPKLVVGLTQDQMRDKIINERRIELSFEEHRYFDVRRWQIAMDVENRPAGRVSILTQRQYT